MTFQSSGGIRADVFADDLAAELTMAAYIVSLRYCAAHKWLDLQLELWRAFSATLARGGLAFSARREAPDVGGRAEDFLAELTYVAYRIALPYGCRQSFLDLELDLHRTLRRATECLDKNC